MSCRHANACQIKAPLGYFTRHLCLSCLLTGNISLRIFKHCKYKDRIFSLAYPVCCDTVYHKLSPVIYIFVPKKIVVAFSQMLWKAAGCSFPYNTHPPNPSESPLPLFSWTIFLQHKQSITRLTQRVILIHQQKDKEPNSLLVFTEVSS